MDNKTKSGVVLVGGLLLAFAGGKIATLANDAPSSPSQDWIYTLGYFLGVALVFSGLGLFFYGAKEFSKKN